MATGGYLSSSDVATPEQSGVANAAASPVPEVARCPAADGVAALQADSHRSRGPLALGLAFQLCDGGLIVSMNLPMAYSSARAPSASVTTLVLWAFASSKKSSSSRALRPSRDSE